MNKTPLAELMRPKHLSDVVGQDHLIGENALLSMALRHKKPLSIVLWGPPGCGKTSIARLYAQGLDRTLVSMNATFSSVADLKRIVKETEEAPLFNRGCALFVDEIHRFNKSQQDAFLPYVENGVLTLIGATAENPSFYLNAALLSRVRVLPLYPLDAFSMEKLLERYERLREKLPLTPEARQLLISLASGDGRYLYNLIENLPLDQGQLFDEERLKQFLQKKAAISDKKGDVHYDLISALHKSVRGSDPEAALYWFSRILEAGQPPLFIARRLIRMASEDIGLADPYAINLAIAAKEAYEMLGSPEGELALAEVVVYLSLAPKSHALYQAFGAHRSLATQTHHLKPPHTILNSPTPLMKELGYGKGYRYDHDEEEAFSGQCYFPEEMKRPQFYTPSPRGFEKELKQRIEYFTQLRQKKKNQA